jgi:hypothetical protein
LESGFAEHLVYTAVYFSLWENFSTIDTDTEIKKRIKILNIIKIYIKTVAKISDKNIFHKEQNNTK